MQLRWGKAPEERVFVLDRSPLLVGRTSDCDIVLDSKAVDARHALLARYLSGWVVHDLRSVNTVRHNGTKVNRAHLASGDKLRIGDVNLFVEGDEEMPVSADNPATADATANAGEHEDWLVDILKGEGQSMLANCCRVEFYLGKKLHRAITVRQDALIGHSERANVRLAKEAISALHALLVKEGGQWYLHDLKGKGAIVHRGSVEATIALADQDEFEIGGFQVRLRFVTEAPGNENAEEIAVPLPDFASADDKQDGTAPARDLEDSDTNWQIPDRTIKKPDQVEKAEKALRDANPVLAVRLLAEVCKEDARNPEWRKALRRAQFKLVGVEPTAPTTFWTAWKTFRSYRRAYRAWLAEEPLIALRISEEGLALDPWHKGLLLLQALIFEHFQDFSLTLWTINVARQRAPMDSNLNRPIAKTLQHLGEYDQCVDFWQMVADADPMDREPSNRIKAALVNKTLRHKGEGLGTDWLRV